MNKKCKCQKVFKVICVPLGGDLIELCTDKNVVLLYRAKKQPNITSLVKRGDTVRIENGLVVAA